MSPARPRKLHGQWVELSVEGSTWICVEKKGEHPHGKACSAQPKTSCATCPPGGGASADGHCPQAASLPPPQSPPLRAAPPTALPQQPSSFPMPPPPQPQPQPQPQSQPVLLPLSSPPLPVVTNTLTGGFPQDPIGSMFRPELGAAGVLVVLAQVLFKPGFTSGRSEEKRLMKSVRSGTVDTRTMPRLLRWLRGERAARELKSRGLKFVGPYTEEVLPPITTGLGMSHLTKELIACGHKAGTKFVVCFTSNYEAFSGVISGVLTDASSVPRFEPDSSMSESNCGESASTSSGRCLGSRRCMKKPSGASMHPPFSGKAARTTTTASYSGSGGGGGGGGGGLARIPSWHTLHPSHKESAPSHSGGGAGISGSGSSNRKRDYSRTDVVAHLFDEIPTHCRGGSGSGSGGGGAGAGDGGGGSGGGSDSWFGASWGGLVKMEVKEWTKYYGEFDGSLLAAWVFADSTGASKPVK